MSMDDGETTENIALHYQLTSYMAFATLTVSLSVFHSVIFVLD